MGNPSPILQTPLLNMNLIADGKTDFNIPLLSRLLKHLTHKGSQCFLVR